MKLVFDTTLSEQRCGFRAWKPEKKLVSRQGAAERQSDTRGEDVQRAVDAERGGKRFRRA